MICTEIEIAPLGLPASLDVPDGAVGVVLFAHGSGSSRFSPRNREVAAGLQAHRIGTLLFDLLTEGEAGDRRNVFDIGLLAERLTLATVHLRGLSGFQELPIGFFGASTGAAAAIEAAASLGSQVSAIVSRGGRPDLAPKALPLVEAATLLIVGGDDRDVLELNRQALDKLTCDKRLAIVPHATHLFEEPGALAEVTNLAAAWFLGHLPPRS
jgi:putative phosphoribosyl transferase